MKKLEFGQTPWDEMNRDELLVVVWRLYAALTETASSLRMAKSWDPGSPYWSGRGVGGRALGMAAMALHPWATMDGTSEDIYRAFFRYAVDLLFARSLGTGWQVCDECGDMLAAGGEREPPTTCLRGHKVRPLSWRDLGRDDLGRATGTVTRGQRG